MPGLEIKDTYKPLPAQEAVHTSRKRHILYGGGVGAGKSLVLCRHALQKAMRWPGIPIVIARYERVDIQRTTEETWRRFIDNRLWDRTYGPGAGYNQSLGRYTLLNGSQVFFIGLKDYMSWMSAEVGMFEFEELLEFAEETYNQMETRLRWTTGEGECEFPECKLLPNWRPHPVHPLYQMVSATNPGAGWVKRRWVDPWKNGHERPDHQFIPAATRDNPYLPPDYEYKLGLNKSATWVKRVLEGDWDAYDGAVFGESFTKSRNLWRRVDPWSHLMRGPVYGGVDWGATTSYAHRTCAYLLAPLNDGRYLVLPYEYSKQGIASEDVFEWIRAQQKMWNVQQWWAGDEQGRTIELLRDEGLPFHAHVRGRGSVRDGLTIMNNLFQSGQLLIHEDCERLLDAIQVYHEKPEGIALRGYGKVDDNPVQRDDDEVDALRHVVTNVYKQNPLQVSPELQVITAGSSVRKDRMSSIIEARREESRDRLKRVLEAWEDEDARRGFDASQIEGRWRERGRA